eukprot:SAG11_NODE_31661_length_290_cov_0.738220_1_plen_21_part_10
MLERASGAMQVKLNVTAELAT